MTSRPQTLNLDPEDDEDNDEEEDFSLVTWTKQEQLTVLDFYGLDTLFPKTYIESTLHVDHMIASNVDSKRPVTITGGTTDLGRADADLGDPLGIKLSKKERRPSRDNLANKENPATSITSKKFNPRVFLKSGHLDTSFRDLEKGLINLQFSVEQRTETMKTLVKTNFSKFVNGKATIDSFYKEMKSRNLSAAEEYGIKKYETELIEAHSRSISVYGPVMDRRSKSAKLRMTLCVLEQWKFFFNLPYSLQQDLTKNKFDAVVRDYKKGKYLMMTSFSTTIPMTDRSLPSENPHHLQVFTRVWAEVELLISQFRSRLFKLLDSPESAADEIINYLIDLGGNTGEGEDPNWYYLESQYRHILRLLTDEWDGFTEETKNLRNEKVGSTGGVRELREICASVKKDKVSALEDKNPSIKYWGQLLHLVFNVTSILHHRMPDFVRLSRSYIDGRYNTTTATKPFSPQKSKSHAAPQMSTTHATDSHHYRIQQCQTMTVVIFNAVSEILEKSFCLEGASEGPLLNAHQFIKSPTASSVSEKKDFISPIEKSASESGQISPQYPASPIPESTSSPLSAPPSTYHLPNILPSQTTSIFPISSADLNPPPHLPPSYLDAHPMISAYYTTRIMLRLSVCFESIKALRMASFDIPVMLNFAISAENVQKALVECISISTVNESKHFRTYEDWSFVSDQQASLSRLPSPAYSSIVPSPTTTASSPLRAPFASQPVLSPSTSTSPQQLEITSTLKMFDLFFKFILRSLQQISAPQFIAPFIDDVPVGSSTTNPLHLITKIKESFVSSLYAFMSGLEEASLSDPSSSLEFLYGPKKPRIDVTKKDSRVLVTISNLTYMKRELIPKVLGVFEECWRGVLGPDRQSIFTTAETLDTRLFQTFILTKTQRLSKIIISATRGISWPLIPKPTDIRPYIYEILLDLVLTHSQVQQISKPLLGRILTELYSQIMQDLLSSFKRIDKFNLGGAMQAHLELTFIQETLQRYETDPIRSLHKQLTETIDRATTNPLLTPLSPVNPALSPALASASNSLDMVRLSKEILVESRQSSTLQFLCFR